jgi:hypothetical protein
MNQAFEKLTSIANQGLSKLWPSPLEVLTPKVSRVLMSQLNELLSIKNGFFAFESALRVFPSTQETGLQTLQTWNRTSLWINSYQGMAEGLFFFAEDVFGSQFAINENGVVSFDPETGQREQVAASVYDWAQKILDEYELLTGYALAHEWQSKNGALAMTDRLIPKTPFVLGGEFRTENLYSLGAVKGMTLRANLATQIRDLPDGAQVRWNIVD